MKLERLQAGKVVKRYQRFLTDVRLEDGNIVTAHCPNSGSMKSCIAPDWDCRISFSDDPKRKLKYTLQLVHNGSGWICINTHLANKIVAEALAAQKVPALSAYSQVRPEVKYGQNSRVDLFLTGDGQPDCYVEVKSVTLLNEAGRCAFPDAVTLRGQKHLEDLQAVVRQGRRAVMFFLIQRQDGSGFCPADEIDAAYGRLLREVAANGVEMMVYRSVITDEDITLGQKERLFL